MRALLYLIIGAIITALGIWWITAAGYTFAAIVAAIVTAIGGFFVIAALATALDMASPTSKRP